MYPNLAKRSIAFDVILGLGVGGVLAVAHSNEPGTQGIAGVLIALAVVTRRFAPSVMVVLALASAVLQVWTADVASVSSLLYAPLFASAGGSPNRMLRRWSLFAAIVGSLIAGWALMRAFPESFGTDSGAVVLLSYAVSTAGAAFVVVGGWAIGFIGHQQRTVAAAQVSETIAELERRRLLDLYDEQAERSRLARDMHDVVAHSLAVVVAQAEGARFTLDAKPEAAREALGVIADTARSALADVRAVLEELRNTGSTGEASRTDRDQLYARMKAAGMDIVETETGSVDSADPMVARVAYQVLIEALTNALKYGDLSVPVTVDHDWTGGCRLTVRNTLSDDPLAPGGARHGIVGMTERAALVGGSLTSAPDGEDWLVELVIPADTEGESS